MQPNPRSQVQQRSHSHPEELYRHCRLRNFEFGNIDDPEGCRQRNVIKCPVEAEYGVQDDADQSSKLVVVTALDKLQRLVVLQHEFAEAHELSSALEVHCMGGLILAMRSSRYVGLLRRMERSASMSLNR